MSALTRVASLDPDCSCLVTCAQAHLRVPGVAEAKSRRQAALKEIRDDMMKGNWRTRLASALVLDTGGQTDHKLSSRLESVDFEGAAKLTNS